MFYVRNILIAYNWKKKYIEFNTNNHNCIVFYLFIHSADIYSIIQGNNDIDNS